MLTNFLSFIFLPFSLQQILQNSKFQRRRKRVKLKENPIRNLGKSKSNSARSLSTTATTNLSTTTTTRKENTLQLWQRSLAIETNSLINSYSHTHTHTHEYNNTHALSLSKNNLTKYLQPTGPIQFLSIAIYIYKYQQKDRNLTTTTTTNKEANRCWKC